MYDPSLSKLITAAMARLQADLAQSAPFMAGPVSAWMKHLAGAGEPADYFQHPLAFPALLLPWWLEQSLTPSSSLLFQADLAYSTINGYYAIRLMDNLMDGQATVELNLLPALHFFETQFQAAYRPYFAGDHPFWTYFAAIWFHSADVTMHDAALSDIDLAQFEQIAAQKTCAAKIPLAAVCYRYNSPQLIEAWANLVDGLGGWHQFLNDLFDWQRDDRRGGCTYFLSQAARQRRPDESVAGWVIREGFEWGIGQLQGWMAALKKQAARLDSPPLLAYLETRDLMLHQQVKAVRPGLQNLARLLDAR
jgi:hypothetical protein